MAPAATPPRDPPSAWVRRSPSRGGLSPAGGRRKWEPTCWLIPSRPLKKPPTSAKGAMEKLNRRAAETGEGEGRRRGAASEKEGGSPLQSPISGLRAGAGRGQAGKADLASREQLPVVRICPLPGHGAGGEAGLALASTSTAAAGGTAGDTQFAAAAARR